MKVGVWIRIIALLVFAGHTTIYADECNRCRERVNDCWKSQKNMSSGVVSMSMINTCSNMQSTCDKMCNYNMGTSPERYTYGTYDCKINCMNNCNLACNYSSNPDCLLKCRYDEAVCIERNCR